MYFMLIALVGRDGMAEIFISYKSERRAAAEHFAEVLRRYGYSVWFDYELVKGKDFAAQIERQIREAKALVALWCSLSVTSRWVREEVHLAHDLGILVPVKIEACELPFGFRLADTIDLTAQTARTSSSVANSPPAVPASDPARSASSSGVRI
jgi:TIR domain